MQELSFKLEVFEGPLDLMLSLIQKHKLNIEDIEIAVLLEQFLLYLEQMQQADIEIAGEFMEMAAHLILIKSSALLPKHEAEQMKKELQGTLIEYAMCKAAAERMKLMFVGADVFVRRAMDIELDLSYRRKHDPYELYEAFSALSDRSRLMQLRRKPLSIKPIVAKSYVTVFTKIVYVLRRVQKGVRVELSSLYKGQNRSEQVATFLALLELSKHGHITFSEDNAYVERSDKKEDDTVNSDIFEDGITDES